MRSLIIVSSALALAVALASFAPDIRSNSGSLGGPLPLISTHDLTVASGPLTTIDYAEAH